MPNLSFNKLNAKVDTSIITLDFNDSTIEIKKYISIVKKIEFIEKIINKVLLENVNYYNPIEVEVLKIVNIIEYYTNITFTEKQREDIYKLYDILISSGLAKKIIEAMDKSELDIIDEFLYSALTNLYKYNNSAFAILESLNREYHDLNFDAEKIQQTLSSNSKELIALRDIMTNN